MTVGGISSTLARFTQQAIAQLTFAHPITTSNNLAMVHKVLIFGASGLLMPHVIPHIVDKFDLEVTAFVRPGSKGLPALKELGIKVIEGSWTDEDLIRRTIEEFDIVWDVGDSASPALPKLLVPLIEQSAVKPTLIRFTGTGNFITQTGGNASTDAKEYDVSLVGRSGQPQADGAGLIRRRYRTVARPDVQRRGRPHVSVQRRPPRPAETQRSEGSEQWHQRLGALRWRRLRCPLGWHRLHRCIRAAVHEQRARLGLCTVHR